VSADPHVGPVGPTAPGIRGFAAFAAGAGTPFLVRMDRHHYVVARGFEGAAPVADEGVKSDVAVVLRIAISVDYAAVAAPPKVAASLAVGKNFGCGLGSVSGGMIKIPTQDLFRLTARSRNSPKITEETALGDRPTFSENGFTEWMIKSGVSDGTTQDYCHAIARYFAYLETTSVSLERAFWQYDTTLSMRRLTGFALRRLERFYWEGEGKKIDFGIPPRLASPSRPKPSPVPRGEIFLILRTARRIYPRGRKKERLGRTFRAWLLLTLEWGARIGETEITWDQIDLERGSVLLRGKTGEDWAPISARGIRILGYLRRCAPAASGPFTGIQGKMVSSDYLYRIFKDVCQTAGLDCHPHQLRHTAVTEWGEAGVPLPYLMRLSRHKSVGAVLWYLRPSEHRLREYAHKRHAA